VYRSPLFDQRGCWGLNATFIAPTDPSRRNIEKPFSEPRDRRNDGKRCEFTNVSCRSKSISANDLGRKTATVPR
jgi:hypothetical protein